MSVPVDHTDTKIEEETHPVATPNSTVIVSDIRTVQVSNISLTVSERDIKEFFSFSGDIQYVEILRDSETTQLAYVTFKDSQGADNAMLLTGTTISDLSIAITPVETYQLPPGALPSDADKKTGNPGSAIQKAEEVMNTMLAKSLALGKEALTKAKNLDERIQLTSNASATVSSIDQKIGLSEKLSTGTALVNDKVREMDEKYQVSEKTKSVLVAAEQKASSAVSVGASWVSSAFVAVTKAAEDAGMVNKEEKKEVVYGEGSGGEPPVVPVNADYDGKLKNA